MFDYNSSSGKNSEILNISITQQTERLLSKIQINISMEKLHLTPWQWTQSYGCAPYKHEFTVQKWALWFGLCLV